MTYNQEIIAKQQEAISALEQTQRTASRFPSSDPSFIGALSNGILNLSQIRDNIVRMGAEQSIFNTFKRP